MSKIAFLFPGQGSQHTGMGKEMVEYFPICKKVFDSVSNTIGVDMEKLCFESSDEELKLTVNAQIGIFTVSMAILYLLRENNILPDVVAGHSLGEYSANVAAGTLNVGKGAKLVLKRGQLMHKVGQQISGAMAAIIGLDEKNIVELCNEVEGIVEVANYNSDAQIVIAGEKEPVEEVMAKAKERKARKCVLLPVSAPFHCTLMEPVMEKFGKVLDKAIFSNISVPLFSNVTGDYIKNKGVINELLTKQICASVRWNTIIHKMLEDGVDTFFEVGPSNVLKSLVRRISKSAGKKVSIYHIENLKTYHQLIQFRNKKRTEALEEELNGE